MKNHIFDTFEAMDLRKFVNKAADVIKKQDNANKRKWLADYNYKYSKLRKEQETFISWKNVKYCKSINEAQQMYGRKWKVVVNNLNNLAIYCKRYTDCQDTVGKIVAIPQTNYELTQMFGTHRNVGKVINKAIECGLLKEVFGGDYSIGKDAKHYWFNDKKYNEIAWLVTTLPNETLLKNIASIAGHHTSSGTIRENIDFSTFSFSSGRKIKSSVSDAQIVDILHTNYSQLNYFERMNEENNSLLKNIASIAGHHTSSGTIRENIEKSTFSLMSKFEPSITRSESGVITKIGIRSFNSVCAMPKCNALYTRADFFSELYGVRDVNEFDVKSSIYRVTYFLNNGEWLSNDIDFYQLMCPYDFESIAERENYKKLCMRLYFGKSADDVYSKMRNAGIIEDSEKNRYFTGVLFDNMRQVIGNTFGSEIFLHESCIYMLLMNKLLKNGFLVTQVYDGFYCDKDIKQICLELLPECANEYIKVAGITIIGKKDKAVYIFKGDNGCREFVNSITKDLEPFDNIHEIYFKNMKEDTRITMDIKSLFDGLLSKQERNQCKNDYCKVAELLAEKSGKKNKKLAIKASKRIVAIISNRGDCEPNNEEYTYLKALNSII